MVKFVIFPVLVVLLAMHTQINAFGLVRVDVQKDPQFANAIGNAISSKIQSWNSILNSLFQVKYGSGGSATVSSGTGGANLAPLYQKTVNINSGYAAAAPPSSGSVANRIDSDDDTRNTASASSSPSSSSSSAAGSGGSSVITYRKSFVGFPIVSVASSASPVASSSADSSSPAASSASSVSATKNVGYSYSKRIV